MIEPRGSIYILRRDSTAGEVVQEPEEPRTSMILPDLEYEILSSDGSESTRDENNRREGKLILSFIFLIIAGAAHSVLAKLQAIPLYVLPRGAQGHSYFEASPHTLCHLTQL